MEVNEKVRFLRELNQLSQEEMAEKLNISTAGYAKIERGERGLNLDKLERIASVFGIEVSDLVSVNDKSIIYLVNENSHHHNHNIYATEESTAGLIEKLQLQLSHKDELILQKEKEIELLRRLLQLEKNL